MSVDASDLQSEVQELKTAMAVQEATMAGQTSTNAAAHSGTWSTMVAGGAAFVIGVFLGIAILSARR